MIDISLVRAEPWGRTFSAIRAWSTRLFASPASTHDQRRAGDRARFGVIDQSGCVRPPGPDIVAVEIDRYLIPALKERTSRFVEEGRLRIINADVRELAWTDVLGDGQWSVVANLPYNIATPLILDLLAQQPQLERWLVMVQREAGERLVAGPGSKTYGIPSVLLAYWAEARLVGSVPSELFLPKPNVESVLVEIRRRENPTSSADAEAAADFASLSTLVRTGFNQRRKMLRKSLSSLVDGDQFIAAGIDPTRPP